MRGCNVYLHILKTKKQQQAYSQSCVGKIFISLNTIVTRKKRTKQWDLHLKDKFKGRVIDIKSNGLEKRLSNMQNEI